MDREIEMLPTLPLKCNIAVKSEEIPVGFLELVRCWHGSLVGSQRDLVSSLGPHEASNLSLDDLQ